MKQNIRVEVSKSINPRTGEVWVGAKASVEGEGKLSDIANWADIIREEIEGWLAIWQAQVVDFARSVEPPEQQQRTSGLPKPQGNAPQAAPAPQGGKPDESGRVPGQVEKYSAHYFSYQVDQKGGLRLSFWPEIGGVPGQYPVGPRQTTVTDYNRPMLDPFVDFDTLAEHVEQGAITPLPQVVTLTFTVSDKLWSAGGKQGYYRNLTGVEPV